MPEEKKLPQPRQVKTIIVGDENLPTHYVNSVNIRAGLEEFFFTFGTAIPLEIADIKDIRRHYRGFFGEAFGQCLLIGR